MLTPGFGSHNLQSPLHSIFSLQPSMKPHLSCHAADKSIPDLWLQSSETTPAYCSPRQRCCHLLLLTCWIQPLCCVGLCQSWQKPALVPCLQYIPHLLLCFNAHWQARFCQVTFKHCIVVLHSSRRCIVPHCFTDM